jgi:hypothetical protein
MVDRVLVAVGVRDRMLDGLKSLEDKLRAANVSFDVADFRRNADEFVGKTMGMYVAEYDKRFSEEELRDVVAFCDTEAGGKFVVEIFKVNRELASNLFFGGGAGP